MSPAVERKAAPADLSLIGGPEPLPDAVVCERLETLRAPSTRDRGRCSASRGTRTSIIPPSRRFSASTPTMLATPTSTATTESTRTGSSVLCSSSSRAYSTSRIASTGATSQRRREHLRELCRAELPRVGRQGNAASAPPKAFFSKDTHYSINKTMDILRLLELSLSATSDRCADPGDRADDPIAHADDICQSRATFTCAYDDVEAIVRCLG